MKKVLDETGILFISDEVQTGWGRTGDHFWGYEAHGVTPDLLTFAKGLGNGLSMAGVVARGEIMDCLQANSISTFGGNPLVCRGFAGQPAVPARPRSAGQRPGTRPSAARPDRAVDRRARRGRRGAGQGPDARRRAGGLRRPHTRPGCRQRGARAMHRPRACSSARAVSSATASASPRRCRSPPTRSTRARRSWLDALAHGRASGGADVSQPNHHALGRRQAVGRHVRAHRARVQPGHRRGRRAGARSPRPPTSTPSVTSARAAVPTTGGGRR